MWLATRPFWCWLPFTILAFGRITALRAQAGQVELYSELPNPK
jgi:hypothetical protein